MTARPFRVVDATGAEVAELHVETRAEAEAAVGDWNRSKAAPRWVRPFALAPRPTVFSVPLGYSNWSGRRDVLVAAPSDTPRAILVRAALAWQRSGGPYNTGNPALIHDRGYEPTDYDVDPDAWSTTGRGRLMGKPVALADALARQPVEIERLREILHSPLYRDDDIRAKARAALTEPRYDPAEVG